MISNGFIKVDGARQGEGVIYSRWTESSGGSSDEFRALQRTGRRQLAVTTRIMLNDPDCFSPTDVAAGQELLDRLSDWD
jgi:hypothetical protein